MPVLDTREPVSPGAKYPELSDRYILMQERFYRGDGATPVWDTGLRAYRHAAFRAELERRNLTTLPAHINRARHGGIIPLPDLYDYGDAPGLFDDVH